MRKTETKTYDEGELSKGIRDYFKYYPIPGYGTKIESILPNISIVDGDLTKLFYIVSFSRYESCD